MLNPIELNVFAMAAETENFSEAARRLGVTQPTVSLHIRSLEERLGIDLFTRSGRNVVLTDAGRALIPLARDILQRCARIEETMLSLKGEVVGLLEIGCTTASGKYVLPRILRGLRDRHPRLEVVCRVTNRHDALRLLHIGDVQVAITSLEEASRDLDYREFATDHIVLITPPGHPWAGLGRPVRPDELLQGEFITREEGSGTDAAVREALADHGIGIDDLPRIMELGNSEAIRMAVAEGIGVGFVSALVATEAGAGPVQIVPMEGMSPQRALYMVRDSSRPATTAQTAFWDFAFSPEMDGVRDRITRPAIA
ncbi:MAG: LysR family transcriptional regulator [Actinobacteria bacterium]|nr:LysR family transcriptional regulator [Actinomycetota bacterium]